MAIRKITRQSVSDQVFEQLKEQLLMNEWRRGEKLPSENELATSFDVSRVTVRHALQKLTALGLIETKLGEGSFVRDVQPGISMNQLIPMAYLNENSLQEIIEFRRVIEGKVAELAAMKATSEDIEKLEKAFATMEQVKEDLQQFSEADLNFHLTVADIAKNSIILQIYHIINDVLRKAFSEIVLKRGNRAGLYYHKLLLEAIKSGDATKARRIMDEHMEDLYDSFQNNK